MQKPQLLPWKNTARKGICHVPQDGVIKGTGLAMQEKGQWLTHKLIHMYACYVAYRISGIIKQ